MGEAGGTQQPPWRHPKARFFGAPPRFFAQEQRNGVERAVGGRDFCPGKRRTRTNPKEKGGTPGEGSPLDPLLRFYEHKESSALCGARPEALPLDSTTFEKVDETFKRARSAQNKKKDRRLAVLFLSGVDTLDAASKRRIQINFLKSNP